MKNFKSISIKEVKENHISPSNEQRKKPDYWLVYSEEIVKIIDDYVASGEYPYNRDIEDLVNKNLFPDMVQSEENRIFSHIVYNTQSFVHDRNESENNRKFEQEMTELGFFKITEDFLKQAAGTEKRFHVVLNTSNIFGTEGKKIVEEKFKLKDWNDQGFYWLKGRSTRKGFRATIGQFVKLIN